MSRDHFGLFQYSRADGEEARAIFERVGKASGRRAHHRGENALPWRGLRAFVISGNRGQSDALVRNGWRPPPSRAAPNYRRRSPRFSLRGLRPLPSPGLVWPGSRSKSGRSAPDDADPNPVVGPLGSSTRPGVYRELGRRQQ